MCLKRKIRNRMMDLGAKVFVQSDDRCNDGYKSLKDRVDGCRELKTASKDREKFSRRSPARNGWTCASFLVRYLLSAERMKVFPLASGGLFPFILLSVWILITIESLQITKSVNSVTKDKKSSDTMGTKHRVDFALYTTFGSINCQLAEKTGFTDADADIVRESLRTLFENDTSSARPDGSMGSPAPILVEAQLQKRPIFFRQGSPSAEG